MKEVELKDFMNRFLCGARLIIDAVRMAAATTPVGRIKCFKDFADSLERTAVFNPEGASSTAKRLLSKLDENYQDLTEVIDTDPEIWFELQGLDPNVEENQVILIGLEAREKLRQIAMRG